MNRYKISLWCYLSGILCLLFVARPTIDAQTQYQIQRGDTVYSIARQYNLSAQDVLRANNISDPTGISIGTNLVIPGAAAPVTVANYTVEKGDTYFNIARRYNISVTQLLRFNNRTADQILRIGEVLRLNLNSAIVANSASAGEPQGGTVASRGNAGAIVRVATTDGGNAWPHTGARKSIRGKFPAIVINASEGDVVRAVTGGRVVHIDSSGAFGRVIFVQSGTGYIYIYGGNAEALVQVGERVNIGTLVGRVGADNISREGSQVYFSVWHNNVFVDPHVAPRG